jgi:hypothetical protein
MTEAQRDYIADLAGRKGVQLDSTDNRSAAWASAKIEELKSMPDKVFDSVSSTLDKKLDNKITEIIREVSKWTFQA